MDLTDNSLKHPDAFVHRHIGPNDSEAREMLALFGFKNVSMVPIYIYILSLLYPTVLIEHAIFGPK